MNNDHITDYEIDKVVFSSKEPYREHTITAYYLKEPASDALVVIFRNGEILRKFLFPAYKIWNIAAHFNDIIDGEIENNASGYQEAASTGFGGSVTITPI